LAWGSIAACAAYHALDMHRMFTSFGTAVGLEDARHHLIRTRVPAPWYALAVEEANVSTPPGRRIAVVSDVQAYLLDRDAIFDCDQPGTRRWIRNLAQRVPQEAAYARQFRQWNVRLVLYIRGKALGASRNESWTPEAVRAWTRFWNARARLRDDVGDCALYDLGPPGRPAIRFDVPGVQEMLLAGILEPGVARTERARRFRAATAVADSGYLRGAYGERLAAEGEPAAGAAELRRAAAIEPRSADVWFSLALAFARAGRPEEARGALARGAAIRPWAEDVKSVQAEIEKAR
ncbi:MAG: tetratricopeptide repeat protein, partial [bacterium]